MENGKWKIYTLGERASYDTYLLHCTSTCMLLLYVHMLRSLCLWMGFKQRAPTQKFLSNLSYMYCTYILVQILIYFEDTDHIWAK